MKPTSMMLSFLFSLIVIHSPFFLFFLKHIQFSCCMLETLVVHVHKKCFLPNVTQI